MRKAHNTIARAAVLATAAFVCASRPNGAYAHAGLRQSDPPAGVRLGATPAAVRLTFSEKTEPSLSVIHVRNARGATFETSRAEPAADDPLSLIVPLRPLGRGIYNVDWRVVSAVDGHATAGAYDFGVRASPTANVVAAATSTTTASRFEIVARWLFLVGLVALVGATAADLVRFGTRSGDDVLGGVGWLLSLLGLALLGAALTWNADTSLPDLLGTPVGKSLIWRALALAAAAGALLVARIGRPAVRRAAMAAAGLAAVGAVVADVAAGHAAAGSWPPAASVGIQSVHFTTVGIWLGGLGALLLGVRGAPSAAKADAVRRFSSVALGGLLVVLVTGLVRTVDELSSWRDLTSTGYGLGVIAKMALILAIAAVGAFNRWRSVPTAVENLSRLRRAGSAELALAIGALAAAAVLTGISPPTPPLRLPGLSVSGSDFGTTVRVRLTTASDQPGPNLFTLRAADYDSHTSVGADRVSLHFTPLDDPWAAPSSLVLRPRSDGSFAASGANISFDGRWRVDALIERPGDSVEVPLQLETRPPPQFVSIERITGQAPTYTVQVPELGSVRFSPDPQRPGQAKMYVTCYDVFEDETPTGQLVLTAAAADGPAQQQSVRRLGRGRFVAKVNLARGRNAFTAVARTRQGTRLRAEVDLEVPPG